VDDRDPGRCQEHVADAVDVAQGPARGYGEDVAEQVEARLGEHGGVVEAAGLVREPCLGDGRGGRRHDAAVGADGDDVERSAGAEKGNAGGVAVGDDEQPGHGEGGDMAGAKEGTGGRLGAGDQRLHDEGGDRSERKAHARVRDAAEPAAGKRCGHHTDEDGDEQQHRCAPGLTTGGC
jgi:hypothetical protein